MKITDVIEFAKTQGYQTATYLGQWKTYEVYEPIFDEADVSFVGLPLVILVSGESIRMSAAEESLEQLHDTNITDED